MIRVILVDDNIEFIETLKYTLEKSGEIEVVALATDGMKGYEACKQYNPDVVLIDLSMPVYNGIKGTEFIKSYDSNIKVVVLTTFNDDEDIFSALSKGADGYILKEVETSEIIKTIKSAISGLGVIHNDILKKVSKMMSPVKVVEKTESPEDFDLTTKEVEVMKYIVHGLSNKEIAKTMNYSEGSVKNMITIILSKTALKDRTQLAVFALKNKIV
ncbi:MAG: response regulator [Clostridiaceae bacterium]